MNGLLKNIQEITYEKTLEEELQKLQNVDMRYGMIQYFINIVKKNLLYDNLHSQKPSIIMLGTNIPEELIYASGKIPYWVMGGLSTTVGWSDSIVPRDTDSVSRSLLGVLINENFDIAKESLIIVPLINDSFKKITYILKNEGYKVHYVCVPPTKNDFSLEEWNSQIEQCIQVISKHTKKNINKNSLEYAYTKVKEAKIQVQEFLKLTQNITNISSVHKMIVLYSYFCTEDIEEWTRHLKILNEELSLTPNTNQIKYKGNVIVMGSPIYFPNFKIPFLLNKIGLNIVDMIDYSTQKFKIPLGNNFQEYINNCFFYDISSAYSNNDTLYEYLEDMLRKGQLQAEGVVYHIIKGQIDFDFELDKFEKLFSKYDIPVFRLETDYFYQDIEQLRIRMEAFAEVIEQKRYAKEKK